MKVGTHNLGSNAFSQVTLAKVGAGTLIIRQGNQTVTLAANQIALLKEVLA